MSRKMKEASDTALAIMLSICVSVILVAAIRMAHETPTPKAPRVIATPTPHPDSNELYNQEIEIQTVGVLKA